MFKLLLVSLLVIHCNSQLISIGGAGYGRTVLLSPHLNGVSSIGSYGLGSLGYTNYGGLGIDGTQSLYGLRPLGGIGLNTYVQPISYASAISPANYGFGFSSIGGLRPQALNLVSAVKAVSAKDSVPVSAAIRQVGRTVEYRTVPYNDEPIVPQYVVVEPSDIPLHIHFKSRSSTIRLSQEHIPGEPGTVEHTRSQDEPSRVVHEVSKPIIQEVREVIQPFRKVTQELQPVIENVHTVVTKGEGSRKQYAAGPVQRGVQQIVQPYDTYQTVAQQFNPYQTYVQPVNSYQTQYDPYGGYQTVPNVISYGTQPSTFGQQIYQQAVNSFLQPFGSTFGSYGTAFDTTFGTPFGQRPVGGNGYSTGGQRPSVEVGPGPNRESAGRGTAGTDQSPAGQPNENTDGAQNNNGAPDEGAKNETPDNAGADAGTGADKGADKAENAE